VSGVAGVLERAWREGGALATLLRPVGALNRVLVGARSALYRSGRLATVPSPLPVVVVGNLSVGGTGKTPLTAHLVERLRARGWRPGIVSRGHGGTPRETPWHVRHDDAAGAVGDEPLMLRRMTGAPVCVCVYRARAVAALAADTDCDLVLSDDGLQHLAMARDAEIVVVDAVAGFGNGRLLPAGPLREPVSRLDSVDLIAIRVPALDDEVIAANDLRGTHERRGRDMPPAFRFATARPRMRRWPDGDWHDLASFRGRRVHAVAGIGRPARFFETLRERGLIVDTRALPDHHVPDSADLAFDDDAPVLVTSKDAVKLDAVGELPAELYEVRVEIETDAGADVWIEALSERLRGRPESRNGARSGAHRNGSERRGVARSVDVAGWQGGLHRSRSGEEA